MCLLLCSHSIRVIDACVIDKTKKYFNSHLKVINIVTNQTEGRRIVIDEDGQELPRGEVGQVAVWRNNKWDPIGDYGYLDENDYFFPKGRSDDVIKSSGYRIGPFEIEATLEKYPGVQQAAVVGSPDEERGEIVKAFIILDEGIEQSEGLSAELKAFVKGRLSMHEYPKEIEYVDELPETPDGKLKRKLLKKMEYERKNKTLH